MGPDQRYSQDRGWMRDEPHQPGSSGQTFRDLDTMRRMRGDEQSSQDDDRYSGRSTRGLIRERDRERSRGVGWRRGVDGSMQLQDRDDEFGDDRFGGGPGGRVQDDDQDRYERDRMRVPRDRQFGIEDDDRSGRVWGGIGDRDREDEESGALTGQIPGRGGRGEESREGGDGHARAYQPGRSRSGDDKRYS